VTRGTASLKRRLWAENGGRCWYCGLLASEREQSIDHVTPLSQGGARRARGNVVPCCRNCNKLKGDTDLETFRQHPRLRARRRFLPRVHPNRVGDTWRFAFELPEGWEWT
jgi:5-methylcytosine-specific restriction endonuclease McrA